MKKLLLAVFALLMFNLSNAQTSPKKAKSDSTKMAAKPSSTNGVVLKKDGTPDKRYKPNAAAGPMKKDGTPDKRYKANKTK